jgi:hypothetical protein
MPHHSRSLLALSQKAIIALRYGYSYSPTAVTAITAALRANHSHHHATTYRQAALSLGLVQLGVTPTHRPLLEPWDSMGVALSFPAEMENRFLGFAAPF